MSSSTSTISNAEGDLNTTHGIHHDEDGRAEVMSSKSASRLRTRGLSLENDVNTNTEQPQGNFISHVD